MAAIDYDQIYDSAGTYPGKRLLDLFVTLAASVILVPVVPLLAAIVALDGHNPFYTQQRVGRHGRVFRMWKLRTMVHDAERRLEGHLAEDPKARAEWDTYQKLTVDPRITRFGRVLRRLSLDELPQFWNVLIGDMSVVGPRPMTPEQQALYPGDDYVRMRPGVTGLWQVSDRNTTTFADRARFDSDYMDRLNIVLDISLVLRTVGVVLKPTGC